MNKTLAALKRISILTYVLLALFILMIIIASIIGIDSDRGVLVGWLGIIFLLIEMTRRWRKEWHFLVLIFGSIIGSILLSGLHELVVGANSVPQNWWVNAFHAIISDSILLFTPMAIIYGVLATITIFIIRMATLRKKRIAEKT